MSIDIDCTSFGELARGMYLASFSPFKETRSHTKLLLPIPIGPMNAANDVWSCIQIRN